MATKSIPSSTEESVDTSSFERVNGQLLERPLPTRSHAHLQRHFANVLDKYLEGSVFEVEAEFSIDRWDEKKSDWLTPDVLVSAAGGFCEARGGHAFPPALLAIEILSSGQNLTNMRHKALILMDWGVEQVWLADPESRSIAMFERGQITTKSEVFYEGEMLLPSTGIHVPLALIFS